MKHLKHIILISFSIFLLGWPGNLFAQEFGSNVKEEGTITLQKENEGFKPDVRVSLGTSFSSFGYGFNSFGTYVAPEISFPINKKFSIQAGIAYSSLYFGGPEQELFSNNSQYGSIYISGTYQVNEKLTVRGTGYKTFLLNPNNFNGETNESFYDFSNQGIRLDLDYKVTDEFRIGISVSYHEQNYPSFYPYGAGQQMNGFGGYDESPFYDNPAFGSGF